MLGCQQFLNEFTTSFKTQKITQGEIDQNQLNALKDYFWKNNRSTNNFLDVMVNVHIITEFCCHVSAVATNCYWDMLDILLK